MKYFAILLLLVSGVVSADYVDNKLGPDGNKVSGVEVNDEDIYESGNNTVTYTVYTVKIKGLKRLERCYIQRSVAQIIKMNLVPNLNQVQLSMKLVFMLVSIKV